MATLREIRKRIASVESTKKITRAMKLVAGARLKKAQDRILAARPYADKLRQMIHHLALHADPADHPLLDPRTPLQVSLIVSITGDRGLCGAFNSNILRQTTHEVLDRRERGEQVQLMAIGRKGYEHFNRLEKVEQYFPDVFHHLDYEEVQQVGEAIIQGFAGHRFDEVVLVYNRFQSAISQHVEVQRLLPVITETESALEGIIDIIYEPSREELLDQILERYIHTTIYRALLESWASEMGARMTAMENATNNAEDLIRALTLQSNKARQAAITKELVELTTGVEALKG
ncbi:MAG: ATP synthase F1 subunit gamma [Bradymonadales bacterium]|nr:ATP synthase F1 subunit gamma [Bradymonadales bacterium]